MFLDPDIEDYRVFQEYYDLRKEAETLEDLALAEECEEVYHYNEDFDVAETLYTFWNKNKLSPESRELLINFYILSYCKLFFME